MRIVRPEGERQDVSTHLMNSSVHHRGTAFPKVGDDDIQFRLPWSSTRCLSVGSIVKLGVRLLVEGADGAADMGAAEGAIA